MEKPLVSVVIPAYNASEYLEDCIDSVSRQSYRPIEIIVIDDGSTDDTGAIVSRLARSDGRIRLISVENGGVSRARNIGIEVSTGEFVTFVDADDLIHPLAIEAMVEAAQSEGAQVCITSFEKGDKAPAFKGRAPKSRSEIYNYREAMEAALYQRRLLNSPWGVLIKRELLTPERRFREGTRYEDLDAFYRMYEGVEKIVYLPYPYYFYRDNPGSFLNKWSDSRLDVLEVTDRMVEFFRAKYPELLPAALDRRFSAHYNMLLLMYRHRIDNSGALEKCLLVVREGRLHALRNPRVRLKNKLGALLSYGGRPLIRLAARL